MEKPQTNQIVYQISLLGKDGQIKKQIKDVFTSCKTTWNEGDRICRNIKYENKNIILKLRNESTTHLEKVLENAEIFASEGIIYCLEAGQIRFQEKDIIELLSSKIKSDQNVSLVVEADCKYLEILKQFCTMKNFMLICTEGEMNAGKILAETFSSSQKFKSLSGESAPKQAKATKQKKKINFKKMIGRIIFTSLCYVLLYFIYPSLFSRKQQDLKQDTKA